LILNIAQNHGGGAPDARQIRARKTEYILPEQDGRTSAPVFFAAGFSGNNWIFYGAKIKVCRISKKPLTKTLQ